MVTDGARTAGEAELTAGARVLSEAISNLPAGRGAMAAPLLGSLAQAGGDPGTLDSLAERVTAELEMVATFVRLWRSAAGETEEGEQDSVEVDLPATESNDADFEAVQGRLREIGTAEGISVEECDRLTVSWFTVGQWFRAC